MAVNTLTLGAKDADFRRAVDVNLGGTFNCTRAALRSLIRAPGGGRIINMTSVLGEGGSAGQAPYVAAKAGIIGLTRTAAKELAPKGINVNAIAPGLILTDMLKSTPPAILEQMQKNLATTVPLNRLGLPRDVANVALFLASDESSYVTGQVIYCDGGMII